MRREEVVKFRGEEGSGSRVVREDKVRGIR